VIVATVNLELYDQLLEAGEALPLANQVTFTNL
jgi:hypothetical protein